LVAELIKFFTSALPESFAVANPLSSAFVKTNFVVLALLNALWLQINKSEKIYDRSGQSTTEFLSLRFSPINIFFSLAIIPLFLSLVALLQKPFLFLKTFWDGLSFYILTCLPELSFLRDITNFDNAVDIFFCAYTGDFPDGLDFFFNYSPDEIQVYSAQSAYGAQFGYWNYPLWLVDSYKLALFGFLVLLLCTVSLRYLEVNQKWFTLAFGVAFLVVLTDLYTEYFLHSSLFVERIFVETCATAFQNFINGLTPMEPVSVVYYTMEEDLIEDILDVRPWFQDNICDLYEEYQRKKKFIRFMRPVWFFLLQRAGTYDDD
jgi:hypothetical protein